MLWFFALPGARIHRSHSDVFRVLDEAPQGRGVDALPIWRHLCRLRPTHRRPRAVHFLIAVSLGRRIKHTSIAFCIASRDLAVA